MWIERSYEAEILDGNAFSPEELFQNLRELEKVNQFLGGHDNSIKIMKLCLQSGFQPDAVIDIGCGGGDTLAVLQKKFSPSLPGTEWIGCDLNPDCLEFAKKQHPGQNLQYRITDFRQLSFPANGRILFHASLFFHHFREEEILAFLKHVRESGAALIINDLHRNPLAWAGIRIIAAFPGIGRLFRNDAPLSVKRGFLKTEWNRLLVKAGYSDFHLQWAWAFRHLIYLPPATPDEKH